MPASTFRTRAIAAFLGLAYGDAYGRTLEFTQAPEVYQQKVNLDELVWTDDTHMSLYVADACLAIDQYDEKTFGHAVGDAFVRWLDDPLTPSTAPGNTCLAGARRYRESGDYWTSGIEKSDGCGAVMRVLPVAIRWDGDDLTSAAITQAMVTHAHPNALEAAIAGAHIFRLLLAGADLDEYLIKYVAEKLTPAGPWHQEGTVSQSLLDGIKDRSWGWLDEEAVHPGDGGWRSGSALGLAIAAALRERNDVDAAIELAARIGGDSDSVACLAGAMVAAANPNELPSWTVPRQDDIINYAGALVTARGT